MLKLKINKINFTTKVSFAVLWWSFIGKEREGITNLYGDATTTRGHLQIPSLTIQPTTKQKSRKVDRVKEGKEKKSNPNGLVYISLDLSFSR